MSLNFKIAQRQTGGKRARMIDAGGTIDDGSAFSFQVIEDATFSVLTAAAGDDSIKDMVYSKTFPAGTTWFTPNLAQNITLSSGSIVIYEE
jgi:hypothetical protein